MKIFFFALPGHGQSRDLVDFFFLPKEGRGEKFFFRPSRSRAKSRLSRFFLPKEGRGENFFFSPFPVTGKVET